jgi:hypothetical protein
MSSNREPDRSGSGVGAQHAELRRNLRWLATIMDQQWRGPFGLSIGWDGLLGFIPIFGDIATTIVSVYIVLAASQLGLPASVLVRMALNIVIDNLVSGVPVLGWLFDFMYKSNLMNIALVDRYFEHPVATVSRSRWLIGGIIASVLTVSTAVIFVMGWLLYKLGAWIIH